MKIPQSSSRHTQTRPRPQGAPQPGAPFGDPSSIPPTLPAQPELPDRAPEAPQPPLIHGDSYPPPPTYRPAPPPALHPLPRRKQPRRHPPRRKRFYLRPGCIIPLLLLLAILIPIGLYLFAPVRTNLVVIGVDYVDPASVHAIGRSDTIMLASILPSSPYVGLISVPRDLWVSIPGVGENRINTAHFFAESSEPGSGPQLLRRTIALNFGVDLRYYVRIRFEGFRDIVDALGGVDIELKEPIAGYPAGRHHLTGRKALAFVRDRSGSDDFFRMTQGQMMIQALIRNLLNPLKWPRMPAVISAGLRSVDTNLPFWLWPRLGVAVLRAGPGGIDSQIIRREMTAPVTTTEGAQVLAPNWELIRPLVNQVFDQ